RERRAQHRRSRAGGVRALLLSRFSQAVGNIRPRPRPREVAQNWQSFLGVRPRVPQGARRPLGWLSMYRSICRLLALVAAPLVATACASDILIPSPSEDPIESTGRGPNGDPADDPDPRPEGPCDPGA